MIKIVMKVRTMRANFMEIVFLTKAEKTNVNASGVEGNITSLKKTTEIDDTQRVFISGASVKYSIKEYLKELGFTLSPVKSKREEAQITTECDPEKYIDDDLFGYMDTAGEKKRVAPVKTNGMISLFPYKNDMNRGVRFDPTGMNHSLYDIEIVTTVFRSNWAIELDRVGKETVKGKEINVPDNEKEKRIKALIEGIFNFWSRVKQSNYLTTLSPQLITMVFRDDKTLTIGDKLIIDQNYRVNIDALVDAIRYHANRIKEIYIGYSPSFISNVDELTTITNRIDVEELRNKITIMNIADLKNRILDNNFNIFITK
jgi:CRISPR-associated protein Cst2